MEKAGALLGEGTTNSPTGPEGPQRRKGGQIRFGVNSKGADRRSMQGQVAVIRERVGSCDGLARAAGRYSTAQHSSLCAEHKQYSRGKKVSK